MRILVGVLLGLATGYGYGFYDGRHNAEPSVLRLTTQFRKPSVSAVQRAESLKTDAEVKLQQNADAKLKAAQ
ncbi:MAG: hypothetical protein Q8K55_14545 [Gemmatimonadaceae bacterium]|nr:hypothetical protein [Gemmatimonadaceae bacterium]